MLENQLEFDLIRLSLGLTSTEMLSSNLITINVEESHQYKIEFLDYSLMHDNLNYYIHEIKEVNDENFTITLGIKSYYQDFTNLGMINKSRAYRALYAITIDNDLKRLIYFLYSVPNNQLKNYVEQLPESIISQLSEFIEVSSQSQYHLKY